MCAVFRRSQEVSSAGSRIQKNPVAIRWPRRMPAAMMTTCMNRSKEVSSCIMLGVNGYARHCTRRASNFSQDKFKYSWRKDQVGIKEHRKEPWLAWDSWILKDLGARSFCRMTRTQT